MRGMYDYINRHVKFSSRNPKYKKYIIVSMVSLHSTLELLDPVIRQLAGELSVGSEVVICPMCSLDSALKVLLVAGNE